MSGTGIPTTRRPRVTLGGRCASGGANRHATKRSRNGSGFPRSLRDGGRPGRRWTKARRRPARTPVNDSGMTTGGHPMASKRRRRRHRSRPAPGEVRAVLAGGASAHTGIANAHTTGASAHNATCAFEGASVPAVVALLWEAATCADPTPARVYLERCGCWPGRHVRAPLPADSVRWLAREAAPEPDAAAGWQAPARRCRRRGVRLAASWRWRARGPDPRCTRRARLPRTGSAIDGRELRRRDVPGRRPGRFGRGDGPGER